MKLNSLCFPLAIFGLALPSLAQTNASATGKPTAIFQAPAALQAAHPSDTQSLIREIQRSLRYVSGRQPRTPEQQAREAAALDRTNDLLQAGKEALHNRNFSAAEEDYRELAQDRTNGVFSYYGLGEALAGQGKTADALATYKTAVYWPLNTGPEGAAFSRAIGNPSNLRGCSFPDDAVAWMKYALLLSQTGQNAEAFSVYSQAVHHANDTTRSGISLAFEAGPPSPVELQAAAHVALGLLTNSTGGDSEQAMTEFEQAQRLAPEAAVTNYYYGYGWKRLDLQSKTRLADAPQAKAALQKAELADDENVKKAASEALNGLR